MKKFLWILLALFILSCTNQNLQIDNIKTSTPHSLTSTSTSTPFVTPTLLIDTPDPIFATQQSTIESCTRPERDWFTEFIYNDYYTNGQWNAFICSDTGIYTKVSNETDNLVWIIPSFDQDLSIPGPEWYWLPYIWSNDGKYLYFKSKCFCYIDGPGYIYTNGFGLSRLSLETGQFDIWLEPSALGYSFEITQGGEFLAVDSNNLSNTIEIKDLITNTKRNLIFKEKYWILKYRFTPDNSHLVILTAEYNNDASKNGFSVFSYNIKSDYLRKLVDKNNLNNSFPTEEFYFLRIFISDLSNDILYLSDTFQENDFQIILETGEIIDMNLLITLTSTP